MDENSQQIMLELSENMKFLTESMNMNTAVRRASLSKEEQERLKNTDSIVESTGSVARNTKTVDDNTRAREADIEAAKKYQAVMNNYADALKGATEGISKTFNNLMKQDPSRSFNKYSDGLSQLGDSFAKAASNFGTVGKIVGAGVQGLTTMFKIQAEQADLLHKANDQLAQFGTAGNFTINQLRDMANAAGVTSKNMEVLVKPLTSLGPALVNLGGTTGQGVKVFADLAKISNAQREQYQRMGISQEQLMQNQADYIQLQRMSGRVISTEAKDRDALRKASLEYTDNLLQLSAISGQDVETLKKKQQAAASEAELQIKNMMLTNQAAKLRAAGDEEGAKKIEKELQMREKLLAAAVSTGDEQTKQAVVARLATGTYTEQSKQLAIMGVNMEEFERRMKAGEDVSGDFLNSLTTAGKRAVESFGPSAVFSEEVRKTIGLNKDFMTFLNRGVGDYNKTLKDAKDTQDKAKKPGTDPAQDARAKLTTLEIEAGKALDKLIGSSNILTGGFTAQTLIMTGLGIAAIAATKGLLGLASKNILGAGKDALDAAIKGRGGLPGTGGIVASGAAKTAANVSPLRAARLERVAAGRAAQAAAQAAPAVAPGAASAATAASSAAGALGRLAGPLAGLAKAAPMIGTVVSVGTGVVDAYQGIKEADKELREGKITKEEAREKKGEAVGGGTGTAVGGAAGALKGAALGATIGSAVPILGTAVGGIIGAALGGWMGAKAGKAIGEVAGGGIAKMTADADKEVDKAKKKAEEKDKKEEDKSGAEKLKDKKDEIVNVRIVSPIPVPVSIVKGVEALAKLGPVPDKKIEKEQPKSDSGSKLTGIALSGALGPLGMLAGVGGLFASKFVKPDSQPKLETQKDKRFTKTETNQFTFSEKDLLEKDAKLYKEYSDRAKEIYEKKLKKLGDKASFNDRKEAREEAVNQAKQEFAERAAKIGAAKISGKEVSISKAPEPVTAKAPEAKTPEPVIAKAPSLPKEFSFSEMELAKKDQTLYKEFSARREELFKEELDQRKKSLGANASAQRLETAERIAQTLANTKAKQEFAERAEKVGAATITRKQEKADIPKGAAPISINGKVSGYIAEDGSVIALPGKDNEAKLKEAQKNLKDMLSGAGIKVPEPATAKVPDKTPEPATTKVTAKVPEPVTAKVPELPKEFTFSEMELAKKDQNLYKEFSARKEELFKQELDQRKKTLGTNASTQRLETAERIAQTLANTKAKQEFAERAEKIGAAKIITPAAKEVTQPKDISIKLNTPKDIQPKSSSVVTKDKDIGIQKGINQIGPAAVFSDEVRKMLDTTLPKTVSQPQLPVNEEETQENFFGSLSQSSDELTDGFVRLTRQLDESINNLGNMSHTFSRYDMKLKRDLTRNIPEEVGDSFEDALEAGVKDAGDLRRQMREGVAPPPSAPSGGAPVPIAPPVAMPPSPPGKPPEASQESKKNLADLKSVLISKGETDENYLNAILGNVMKETGGKVVEENLNYGKTDNSRIRSIFGERAAGMSDAQLNQIKQDPKQMGEFMYGSGTTIGKRMGNLEPGDGWKYRGRGYIQLTGKTNYLNASQAIFGDDRLVKDPDLVNDPKIAAEVTAWYMQKSKGRMQQKLGISGPMSQAQANQLATSQVAGRVVQRDNSYLGSTLSKVDQYSNQVAGIKPSSPAGGTAVASAPSKSSGSDSSSGGGFFSTISSLFGGKKEGAPTAAPAGSHNDGEKQPTSPDSSAAIASAKDSKSPKEQVEKAGLKVRPYGDVYQGGLLTETALSAARAAQDQIPGFGMFTGLNDVFHKEKHPRSKHAIGQGIDFTLTKMPTIEESKEIKSQIQKIPGVSYVANEYYGPPHGEKNRNTTGPHFHFQTSARDGAVIDGPEAGYPVDLTAHGREVIAPLMAGSILEMLSTTPANQQNTQTQNFTNINNETDSGIKNLLSMNEHYNEIMLSKLDLIAEKLSQSNDTQGRILQYTKV